MGQVISARPFSANVNDDPVREAFMCRFKSPWSMALLQRFPNLMGQSFASVILLSPLGFTGHKLLISALTVRQKAFTLTCVASAFTRQGTDWFHRGFRNKTHSVVTKLFH